MKKYQIIYADPPWDVKFGLDNHRERRKSTGSPKGTWSAPMMNYQTMSIDEIKLLPIKQLSADNAVLFLWVINKFVEESYSVARAWGFKPITLLTWAKSPRGLGLGGAFVQTTEHLLFCRKGHLQPLKRCNTTWWNWKRPEKITGPKHSRKPDDVYDIIQSTFGDLSRIELFARQKVDGWDCWGNEVESDIELTN